jgi:hypothetical protein
MCLEVLEKLEQHKPKLGKRKETKTSELKLMKWSVKEQCKISETELAL